MSATTDKSDAINFGKILKIEMAGTGDSAQSIANRADLHRSHISDICRGRKSPNLATVRKIADAFPESARNRIILFYAREVLCAQIADLVDISIKPQSAKSQYQLDGVDREVTSSSLERYVKEYSNERVGA